MNSMSKQLSALLASIFLNRLRWFQCVLTVFYMATIVNYGATAELSATAILEASQLVMTGTLKAHQVVGKQESILYQKRLPSGDIVFRLETRMPMAPTNKIVVRGTNTFYEFYPDHGLAIDMGFIQPKMGMDSLKALSAQVSATAGFGNTPVNDAILKGKITERGVECYQIEASINPAAVEAARRHLQSKLSADKLPARWEYSIGVQDMVMHRSKLVSRNGNVAISTELHTVELNPKLSDDLFELPSGLTIEHPKSSPEYTELWTRTFIPPRPEPSREIDRPEPTRAIYSPLPMPVRKAPINRSGSTRSLVVIGFICANLLIVGAVVAGLKKRKFQKASKIKGNFPKKHNKLTKEKSIHAT